MKGMKSSIGSATANVTLLLASGAAAATGTNNNDSCEISTAPAATLLLPYFEVDFNVQIKAQTTLFTVVNTNRTPEIARVTLWTDLGYPVLDFNLFLTGYDVQSINLYDVFGPHGIVAPPGGTTSRVLPGDRSLPNTDNPNFARGAMQLCATNPGPLAADILQDVRSAFTIGRLAACGSSAIGLPHSNAIGYATIDVVRTCDDTLPTATSYYAELLYDNVLTGDYQQVVPTGNYATGNSLVHIRAISGLPYTFYDRYTPRTTPGIDRRQPLPSVFAARFVQNSYSLNTNFHIWREGITGTNAACSAYQKNTGPAAVVTENVRFDEHENPTMLSSFCVNECQSTTVLLPEASSTPVSWGAFPPMSTSGDIGGWMYLNLNNKGSAAYSTLRASQNWVTVTMYSEGRYSVEFDAAAIVNGCTPPRPKGARIGPNS